MNSTPIHQFSLGDIVWRGARYWPATPLASEIPGWNTEFLPYRITKITANRITIDRAWKTTKRYPMDAREAKFPRTAQLNPDKFENGKCYHSRFHEYFYICKPITDPEHEGRRRVHEWEASGRAAPFPSSALSHLGLHLPCTKDDIRRAFKRMALKAHPDTGGSHEQFLKLKLAYEQALRVVR